MWKEVNPLFKKLHFTRKDSTRGFLANSRTVSQPSASAIRMILFLSLTSFSPFSASSIALAGFFRMATKKDATRLLWVYWSLCAGRWNSVSVSDASPGGMSCCLLASLAALSWATCCIICWAQAGGSSWLPIDELRPWLLDCLASPMLALAERVLPPRFVHRDSLSRWWLGMMNKELEEQEYDETQIQQNTGLLPLLSDLYCVYVCWMEHEGRQFCCGIEWHTIWHILSLARDFLKHYCPFFFQEGTFGAHCSQICQCNKDTSSRCDPVKGDCACNSGWQGKRKNLDAVKL